MRLNQSRRHLHSKRTCIITIKRFLLKGRRQLHIMPNQGLKCKIYKELIELNNKKDKVSKKEGTRDRSRHFQRRYPHGIHSYEKRCSTPVSREMEITTMRCHFTALRMLLLEGQETGVGEDIKRRSP